MRKIPPDLASIVIQACRAEVLIGIVAGRPLQPCYQYVYSGRHCSVLRPARHRHRSSTVASSRHYTRYLSFFSKPKHDATESETTTPPPPTLDGTPTQQPPDTPVSNRQDHPPPPIRPPNPPTPRQPSTPPNLPFKFETGIALFAKRTPRPFPPPFLSRPSGSFSDALSTHDTPRLVDGSVIRGRTNGDDAVFASPYFICADDGVGAWSTRPRGHAGLWARLILHFWADEVDHAPRDGPPDPVATLQAAYERTQEATREPNEWLGTTTAAGAQLYYEKKAGGGATAAPGGAKTEPPAGTTTAPPAGTTTAPPPDTRQAAPPAGDKKTTDSSGGSNSKITPLLYVTNLGDSQVMVIRPSTRSIIYKTTEQWHWFDCPRQLGTNSPDTPRANAVVDAVPIREGDVVLAMSDGVIDNLWSHEIVTIVCDSKEAWDRGEGHKWARNGMHYVAHELVERAKKIALDPFAESPFMEHAIEEGLPSEGGKLDDISVVAALCMRNEDYESS